MSKITFVCLVVAIICNLQYSKGLPQYTWNEVSSRKAGTFRYFTHYSKTEPESTDKYVLYIMFNPSTGRVDGKDDPTIRKIKELTEQKFPTVTGFKILNLFAYMNPLPEKLLQTLHLEEQRLIGANRPAVEATKEAFDIVKGKDNEPETEEWKKAANGAEKIIAAWGDLPTIPSANELKREGTKERPNKFTRFPDLVTLINANRNDWRRKWIPMIKARKNKIANWLNTKYRNKRGYFLLSGKKNPRHPLKLKPTNDDHDFENKQITIHKVKM